MFCINVSESFFIVLLYLLIGQGLYTLYNTYIDQMIMSKYLLQLFEATWNISRYYEVIIRHWRISPTQRNLHVLWNSESVISIEQTIYACFYILIYEELEQINILWYFERKINKFFLCTLKIVSCPRQDLYILHWENNKWIVTFTAKIQFIVFYIEVLWLGPSLRSFLLFWLCVVHHIVSKEGSIVLVSRVFWYMELKPGQWRLMICEVWKGRNVWWWDGCVGCPWRTEGAVRIYATFLVLIVLLMWWGVEDWDGLDIWNVRV